MIMITKIIMFAALSIPILLFIFAISVWIYDKLEIRRLCKAVQEAGKVEENDPKI